MKRCEGGGGNQKGRSVFTDDLFTTKKVPQKWLSRWKILYIFFFCLPTHNTTLHAPSIFLSLFFNEKIVLGMCLLKEWNRSSWHTGTPLSSSPPPSLLSLTVKNLLTSPHVFFKFYFLVFLFEKETTKQTVGRGEKRRQWRRWFSLHLVCEMCVPLGYFRVNRFFPLKYWLRQKDAHPRGKQTKQFGFQTLDGTLSIFFFTMKQPVNRHRRGTPVGLFTFFRSFSFFLLFDQCCN